MEFRNNFEKSVYNLGKAYGFITLYVPSLDEPTLVAEASIRPVAGIAKAIKKSHTRPHRLTSYAERVVTMIMVNVTKPKDEVIPLELQGVWYQGFYSGKKINPVQYIKYYKANKGGEALQKARENAGLTQTRAAEFFGIKQYQIAKWEKGEGAPTHDQLKWMAEFYGCKISDLTVAYDIDKK